MEIIAYLSIGLIIGVIIGWFIAKARSSALMQVEKEEANKLLNKLDKDFTAYKASSTQQLSHAEETIGEKQSVIDQLNGDVKIITGNLSATADLLSTSDAYLKAARQTITEKHNELNTLKEEAKTITKAFDETKQHLATANANNTALGEKLEKQKDEIEELGKKFNLEFENIANKILEEKTEKFTSTNKTNLETILKPLGDNLDRFKKQVEEVYDKESKERFSLGDKVKELVSLNEKLSKEAHNLTLALKADPKAQGNWGEMILESILEQSGLTKDREYFLENYLKDEHGNYLLNEEGKKMRPDAIIQYPDERKVIIDSKVSLNAYTNYMGEDDEQQQTKFLKQHVQDVKNHIVSLSKRGYENFDKSLDFVMMFIPNEPAYMVAVKEEPNLWNFAFDKRIILISPTNLIAALKLISNLWSREHQSRNAQAIVNRGEKLYSKFVGFAENFKKVGKGIDTAQDAYSDAFKQLATGNDNLIRQAEKLKALKIEPKKSLPAELLEGNQEDTEIEII